MHGVFCSAGVGVRRPATAPASRLIVRVWQAEPVALREFTSNCKSQRTIRCSAKVMDLNQFVRGRHFFLSCSPRGSANTELLCVDGTEFPPPTLALLFGNFSAACAEL